MRERYLPALIMLIAGAITSIFNIVNKVEILIGLKRLLLVLIIFYILGMIVKVIVRKLMENSSNQASLIDIDGNDLTDANQNDTIQTETILKNIQGEKHLKESDMDDIVPDDELA